LHSHSAAATVMQFSIFTSLCRESPVTPRTSLLRSQASQLASTETGSYVVHTLTINNNSLMKTHYTLINRAAGALAVLALGLVQSALGADGYANVGGTTTGGSGTPVTVTTLAQLTSAASDDVSRVVRVSGTINLGSSNFRVGSNKTLIGVGAN